MKKKEYIEIAQVGLMLIGYIGLLMVGFMCLNIYAINLHSKNTNDLRNNNIVYGKASDIDHSTRYIDIGESYYLKDNNTDYQIGYNELTFKLYKFSFNRNTEETEKTAVYNKNNKQLTLDDYKNTNTIIIYEKNGTNPIMINSKTPK